jgi:hypothetical protein
MLTFIESISLAGDRKKQNDDAFGFTGPRAWVIDGATDLHDTPLTSAASDASWLARHLNAALVACPGDIWTEYFSDLSCGAAQAFNAITSGRAHERWRSPIASVLMVCDRSGLLYGGDLGDCRVIAPGADGAAHTAGGLPGGAENETQRAAQQSDAHKPLLERVETIARLREQRAAINREGAEWTFGLDPECGKHLRLWQLQIVRPAHVLLMTDGFSALVDRYGAYDEAGLVRAALDKGLQELGRELRAIETQDAGGVKHPRFKASDDATALLMRLT